MPETARKSFTRGGIDPRGFRFAAGITAVLLLIVGFLGLTGVSTAQLGAVPSAWFGVPWALVIAAAAAFVAASLNAVFGLCLGCRLYLLLQRAGIVGRARPASA